MTQVRQGKWPEALEMLGEENPFRDVGMRCLCSRLFVAYDFGKATTGPHVANCDGGIKVSLNAKLYVYANYM